MTASYPELHLMNIPLINLRQEFYEYYRLLRDDAFCAQFSLHPSTPPIRVPHALWLSWPQELLTHILQKAILSIECYVRGTVINEAGHRGLYDTPRGPELSAGLRNPFGLGGRGTADNFYNRLPGLLDHGYSLRLRNPPLWENIRLFYREVRNPLFHGYEIHDHDPRVLLRPFDEIDALYDWIDGWRQYSLL